MGNGAKRDSRLRIAVVAQDDLRPMHEQLATLADARERAVCLHDLRARPWGELADAPGVADFARGRGRELPWGEGRKGGDQRLDACYMLGIRSGMQITHGRNDTRGLRHPCTRREVSHKGPTQTLTMDDGYAP